MNFGKINKNIKIRFCGMGGMGVILVSVILGKAAIYDGKNAAQTQSYGSEQRGTKVKSDIIISNKDLILSPFIDRADILIAFSQDAYNYYSKFIYDDSLIIINSDLVNPKSHKNLLKIPATSISSELKNDKVMNMVVLGYLIKNTNIVSLKSVIKAIKDTINKKYHDINIEAFNRGYNFS